MRGLHRAIAVAALLVPLGASAQVTLGVRVGAAKPLGEFDRTTKMQDLVATQYPIQVDALYRFTPEWAAGVYGAWTPATVDKDLEATCKAFEVKCSMSGARLGIQGTYTFTHPTRPVVPWVGLGLGMEWLMQKVSDPLAPGTLSQTASGLEVLDLQLGWDYVVTPEFAVGLALEFRSGTYTKLEGHTIPEQEPHVWLGVALRGRYDL